VDRKAVASSAFGTLLRRHRLEAGLSQEVLAERARVSVTAVSALERGVRRSPYRETVALLAQALNLAPPAAAELHAAASRPQNPRNGVSRGAEHRVGFGPQTNLPAALTALVGRTDEIADVTGMLAINRLVTLIGTGGIGKTRTALAVGEKVYVSASGGVWLVELAPVTQGSLIAAAVARVLSVEETKSRPLLDSLLEYLKDKSSLLILDNCEHVVGEAAAFAQTLLRRCPQLRILATSREPLHIAGEQAYRLPSLPVPAPDRESALSAAEAERYGAIVLFVQRARANDQTFECGDDNVPLIAEVCRRLDGIPLALELAAAQMKTLTLPVLAAKLDQRFRLLTGGERTAMPRHQTMRALFDWSYALLCPAEQRLFERLSIFAGGCTLETATAVYADESVDEFAVLTLLSSLVDKSLVEADLRADETRYRLLESSRRYAREKLDARGQTASVSRLHARAQLALAEKIQDTWDIVPDDAWYRQAEANFEDWNAALDWALHGRSDVVLGQRLAGALCVYWQLFAPLEGRRWIRSAAALVDESTPREVIAQLDFAEAFIAAMFFEFAAALSAGERAFSAFNLLDDRKGALAAQRIVGISLVVLGRIAEGAALLNEALNAARTLGKTQVVGWLAVGLGLARSVGGDSAGARACYAQALALFQELGAERSAAMVALNLAGEEARWGDAAAAARLAAEATATFRARNRLHDVMNGLIESASYHIVLAEFERARLCAREALDLSRERQWTPGLLVSMQHLAAIAALDPQRQSVSAAEARSGAARLLGFVDARLSATGITRDYVEEHECADLRCALHNHFAEHDLARLFSDGAALSEAQAIELARSVSSPDAALGQAPGTAEQD
jgi:predicted ATPase/transcriptional regulator with XRE-family HTH domain